MKNLTKRIATGAALALTSVGAFAADGAADPFASVDLTLIVAGVASVGGTIVLIALSKKGFQMAARMISSVK